MGTGKVDQSSLAFISMDCDTFLRRHLSDDLSSVGTDLVLRGKRDSTVRQRESVWKVFKGWCSETNVSSVSKKECIDFLACLINEKKLAADTVGV